MCLFITCMEQACTILLRGASKDILMEVERNLQDAMQVARNVMVQPRLLPGGGAVELTPTYKYELAGIFCGTGG